MGHADSAAAPIPRVVVCLGDSVTKGARPGVEEGETFCALLEQRLTQAGRPVRVINAGVGGHTTADALERLERDVLAHQPDTVTLMFGINDSWIYDGTTTSALAVEAYRENLRQMVDRLQARGISPLLLTPNPVVWPERNRTMAPYVAAMREVAGRRQTVLIDIYQRFAEAQLEGTPVADLLTDGMHPNPEGHRLIAGALADALEKPAAEAGAGSGVPGD